MIQIRTQYFPYNPIVTLKKSVINFLPGVHITYFTFTLLVKSPFLKNGYFTGGDFFQIKFWG